MNGVAGDFGITHFKVSHPHISNNIPPMRSNGFQPPFIAGGNQVAYYLGIKGNNITEPEPCGEGCYSTYKKVIKKHRKK
jgi:hypothetical protein